MDTVKNFNGLEDFAEKVAADFFERFDPELHRVMVEKIIEFAAEKWFYQYTGNRVIRDLIDKGVERALAEKYGPVFRYIADQKAREKALRHAKKNGVEAEKILSLFEECDKQ